MNKLLIFAVLVQVLTVCYAGHFNFQNNEGFIKIKSKICSEKPEERPTPEQWTAYMNCSQHRQHRHKKFAEKLKTDFDECANKADDVNNLKTTVDEQNKIIYFMCSKKFRDCHQQQRNKWMEENKDKIKPEPDTNKDKIKPEPDTNDDDIKERRDAMKKKFDENLACSKTALGIA